MLIATNLPTYFGFPPDWFQTHVKCHRIYRNIIAFWRHYCIMATFTMLWHLLFLQPPFCRILSKNLHVFASSLNLHQPIFNKFKLVDITKMMYAGVDLYTTNKLLHWYSWLKAYNNRYLVYSPLERFDNSCYRNKRRAHVNAVHVSLCSFIKTDRGLHQKPSFLCDLISTNALVLRWFTTMPTLSFINRTTER